jgi:hypothetical protein
MDIVFAWDVTEGAGPPGAQRYVLFSLFSPLLNLVS